MAQTNVTVLNQVWLGLEGRYRIGLQWCAYVHPDEPVQMGYRFIWKRANGTLQAARGQARLPSLAVASRLMELARADGWGDNVAVDADEYA